MKTHFKQHKILVQSIQYSWNMTSGARNLTSLHLRSKFNYPRKSKNFSDLYEITLYYNWVQRSKVNFQGQLSKVSKAKNFGDLYEITLHYIWGQRSKVNYPNYLKQKISVTSIFMKTHFKWHKKIVQSIQYSWNMTSGARNYTSLHLRSKVNYPRKSKKFWWLLWNYISLHLRSKVQGQLFKVSKAKNFSDLYEITLHYIWGQRSKVNYPKYLKQKISVTSIFMKTHFKRHKKIVQSIQYRWNMTSGARNLTSLHVRSKFNYPRKSKNFSDLYEITLYYIWVQRSKVNFQVQLSKVSKAKNFGDLYEITFHYIWGQRSTVNYPKYLKQKISVTSIFMKTHFKWHKKIVQSIQYSWNMMSGARNYTSLHVRSKVNYPRKSKKFRCSLWNYTSLHLRSKVQGQFPRSIIQSI